MYYTFHNMNTNYHLNVGYSVHVEKNYKKSRKKFTIFIHLSVYLYVAQSIWKVCSDLMVSALDSGGSHLSPGWSQHHVAFFDKRLNSHSTPTQVYLHKLVLMNLKLEVTI